MLECRLDALLGEQDVVNDGAHGRVNRRRGGVVDAGALRSQLAQACVQCRGTGDRAQRRRHRERSVIERMRDVRWSHGVPFRQRAERFERVAIRCKERRQVNAEYGHVAVCIGQLAGVGASVRARRSITSGAHANTSIRAHHTAPHTSLPILVRIALAALHLLALGIGLGAVWARAGALGERPQGLAAIRRALAADAWWGIAALLWISTGVARLLAGTEKATSYYLHNHLFLAKMGCLGVIFLLEVWAMVTLGGWRRAVRRSPESFHADEIAAARIARISRVEVVLVAAMVLLAVMMARGYGARA